MSASIALRRPGWPALRLLSLPATVVFPTFIVIAGVLLCIRPALDPDLGVHIRTGMAMIATHHIPRADTFSYTLAGAPWADFEWLWELGLGALYGAGGMVALVLANAGLVGTALALVYARLRLAGSSALIATFGAGLGLIAILPYAEVRPGMVGFVFAGLFLMVLELSRAKHDWRWLMLLLPAEFLWANAHGSYAIGPLLCGTYAIAAVAERWELRAAVTAPWREILRLAAAWSGLCGALLVVALANPMGAGLLRFTFGAGHLTFNREHVGEWRPPDFNQVTHTPLLLGVLASIALPLLFAQARLAKREALLLAVATLAALKTAQFTPLYAVAAAPLLARLLEKSISRRFSTNVTPFMGTALLAGVAVLGLMAGQSMTPLAMADATSRAYPVAALRLIESEQLPGPIWNDYGWGSYLIANAPNLPVFVDGRAEMYGDEFLHRYLAVMDGEADPQSMLDSNGVNLVLIPPKTALATILRRDAGWREAFRDDVATIFVRVEPLA